MSTEILIIGMNKIGLSINLALKEGEANLNCTGYDAESKLSRAARKRGDIDKVVFTTKKTAQTADLIFLAVSPKDVIGLLEQLVPIMKRDAVLVDLSSLKAVVYQWTQENLPEDRYYVGAVPVLNPDLLDISASEPLDPRSDLFKGGVFALTIPPNTPEKVVNGVLGIINFLQAEPFFIDPHELDASMAMVEGLPTLSGLALMRASFNAPSWRELQRLTGRSWATAANVGAKESSTELAASLILNKDNMIHRLNDLVSELETMRSMIYEEDEEALSVHLEEAAVSYMSWIARRKQGNWDADQRQQSIPKVSITDRLFGGGRLRKE
jgi:prephenate dehydrogenase